MKKLLFIALVLSSIILSSCNKDEDYTDPDNLAGTEWKSLDTEYSDEEYYLFKFTTKTIIEMWIKYEDDTKVYNEMSGIYSILGNAITINFDGDPVTGVIDGNTMNFAYDGEVITFKRQ